MEKYFVIKLRNETGSIKVEQWYSSEESAKEAFSRLPLTAGMPAQFNQKNSEIEEWVKPRFVKSDWAVAQMEYDFVPFTRHTKYESAAGCTCCDYSGYNKKENGFLVNATKQNLKEKGISSDSPDTRWRAM